MKELPVSGTNIREIVTAINQLIRGKSNAIGSLTLTPSTTTTVVKVRNIAPETSQVFLSPRTANASTATWHITIQAGQFTVHHASAASADRTFGYAVLG